MPTAPVSDWRTEFGLEGRLPPSLFTSKEEISSSTAQAHLLRRAFDTLAVDGVLCADQTPLAYFKLVEQTTPQAIAELHRQFWNHGGASLLVVVTGQDVQIYSGMACPSPATPGENKHPSLVETLERAADKLGEFIFSVESGEFFGRHQKSFDPNQRVDRYLLDNLADTRTKLNEEELDPLLCRLVFTCYLFDREVIVESYLKENGLDGILHLRDMLGLPVEKAKEALYLLFAKLRQDFNGDLFSDDLDLEREKVCDGHIATLCDFFHGTQVLTGQTTFWPYDFKFIPIETISAIYERFLKDADKEKGAFYTPRFLAEIVLDSALEGCDSLLGKRFLDPSCGSGIFLVGLFNRLAEEWKQANPAAPNDQAATELMRLLRESLFGVDVSLTACRITAFSLYLAYLDKLLPRDIQALQRKGKALPRLVAPAEEGGEGNIRCMDFFEASEEISGAFSLVIGNPPWGSIAADESPAGIWCARQELPLPDKQIAAAFVWKAARHVVEDGRVCFVLPHGVLFNHSQRALEFQKVWLKAHTIERVLNLADFQRFLFEKAGHPAVVVSYRREAPEGDAHRIEYWGPKADWTVTKAEVITVAPQDRTSLTIGSLLKDLDGPDAPQLWKQRFWATPRDWRLLDRLGLYPRLRDIIRQPRDHSGTKRWIMSEGFQPLGESDDADEAVELTLPSEEFIEAKSKNIDLFLLRRDCASIPGGKVTVRKRSNKNTTVFRAPHVLVSKGYSSVAFADFDVSFRHALRGIHGPTEDNELLAFLAAYLRSNLARYFLFHTSSNWGISRQEVHVEEVVRLPFPLPEQQPDPRRAHEIVSEVASIVRKESAAASVDFADRDAIIQAADCKIAPLINEYFDIIETEGALIEDTAKIIIGSTRPTRARPLVPTIAPASRLEQSRYIERLCSTLNGWAKQGAFAVRGYAEGSELLGVGIAVLEKVERDRVNEPFPAPGKQLLSLLRDIRQLAVRKQGATINVTRGVMLFEGSRLYLVRPIGRRYWTQTAALNDADSIANSILMSSSKESS